MPWDSIKRAMKILGITAEKQKKYIISETKLFVLQNVSYMKNYRLTDTPLENVMEFVKRNNLAFN